MRYEVEAILFDIDGTLVGSTDAVERTWRAWANQRGIDPEKILQVCHGRRTADTVAEFVPPEQREAAVAELENMELADLDDILALPGTHRLLEALPRHRWAAVTSGGHDLMGARLAAAGLPKPEILIGAEDVRVGKPAPEGYLAAAAALGVDPTRCLVIEDSPAGIAAGRAAEARTLAVATSHDPQELTEAEATVDDLSSCSLHIGDALLTVDTHS